MVVRGTQHNRYPRVSSRGNRNRAPNPTYDVLQLIGALENEVVVLTDLQGRVIDGGQFLQQRSNQGTVLHVARLNAGVYFITVVSDKGAQSLKFVKL